MEAIDVPQLAKGMLHDLNHQLEERFNADVLMIKSPMVVPLDGKFRIEVEAVKSISPARQNLCIILETTGGYIEVVKRLVDVMRKHYEDVAFVVPDHAFSAGTVLALSGDRIFMDYFSVLGPIDPQVADESGKSLLPGAGYLAKFEELLETINGAKGTKRAELAYLIKQFDPAKLFHIEQAIEHGQALIAEWLPRYKFKDWDKTSSGEKVTSKMRKKRAQEIAKVLGDVGKWHSHGRGISMEELKGEEIKLHIDDFGVDADLSSLIRNYHGLAIDFANKRGLQGFIHSKVNLRSIF